jgi:hypothetical protein
MRSTAPWPRPAWFLILLSVLLSACGGSTTPTGPAAQVPAGTSEPREGFVIQTGLVLDFRTLAPLPGARVVFGPFTPGGPGHDVVADASGIYRIEVVPDDYLISVDGVVITGLKATVSSDRAHLFARAEGCSAIYGVVDDARTGRPLPGVVVSSGGGSRTTSTADGWYRLDYGCGVNLGFNTMMAYFSHAGYESASHVVGRGAPNGARRIDMGLKRQ